MKTLTLRFCLSVFLCSSAIQAHAQFLPTPVGAQTTLSSNPYFYAGRISANVGTGKFIATGTVLRPSGVITCAHILYDVDSGFSTNVVFERGLYNSQKISTSYASATYVLSGYQTSVATGGMDSTGAFSRDLGGIKFLSPLSGKASPVIGTVSPVTEKAPPFLRRSSITRGAIFAPTPTPTSAATANYSTNKQLFRSGVMTMSLGYGGVVNNGQQLLSCSTSKGYFSFLGPYLGTTGYVIEGGMSGGPIFAFSGGVWYIIGVNVSSNGFNASGIYSFGAQSTKFISQFLN